MVDSGRSGAKDRRISEARNRRRTIGAAQLKFCSLPNIALLDIALLDIALPDIALLDIALPDIALLDKALPDKALPDIALPDIALPDNRAAVAARSAVPVL